jgi:hypothetical protein
VGEKMRRAIVILILLIPSLAFSATFVDDEFSGDLSAWTQSGNGVITTSGGYLSITSSDIPYDAVSQSNITGPFDIVARLKDTFYPDQNINATKQCAFYVEVNATNYVTGYQNRNDAEGKNEIMLLMLTGNVPNWLNTACDPMEYVCIRIKRDDDNYFWLYKNAATDCSGEWTEVNPEYRLQSADPVTISIRAKAPEASTTYLTDYVRTYGGFPASTSQGYIASGAKVE